MLSKLDEFQILMNMKITDFMPTEYGMDLFHYTSPVGLNSILFGDSSKVTMWASRYDCLNDFSEGGVVGPVFQEACMELKETGEIDEYLYNLFSKVAPARTILLHYFDGKKIRITRPECDRYICSFSKNKDSLAMWNYYSKGSKYEGFNIGFFPACLKDSLHKFLYEKEAIFHIYPVIYKRDEQKKLIKDLLIRLRDYYDKEQETSIRYIISNKLTDWLLVFKR